MELGTTLLCSTILGRKIESGMGNDRDILPSIFAVLRRLDRNLAQQCEDSIIKRKAPQNNKHNLENEV